MDDPTRKEGGVPVGGDESDCRRVFDRALRLLSLRSHGVEELRQKLVGRGENREAVAYALAECLRLGYLDDADLVYRRTIARMTGKGYGPHKIRNELLQLGIAPELVARGMARALAEVDIEVVVKKIFVKHCSRWISSRAAILDRSARKRCFDYLFRRGFDTDTIHLVLP
ncbi:MAG: RecX family transcriptional regulator [Magnetococcales bacterium]|nr:RecX family transcriptional regulator [Magnetococcales bacterium]